MNSNNPRDPSDPRSSRNQQSEDNQVGEPKPQTDSRFARPASETRAADASAKIADATDAVAAASAQTAAENAERAKDLAAKAASATARAASVRASNPNSEESRAADAEAEEARTESAAAEAAAANPAGFSTADNVPPPVVYREEPLNPGNVSSDSSKTFREGEQTVRHVRTTTDPAVLSAHEAQERADLAGAQLVHRGESDQGEAGELPLTPDQARHAEAQAQARLKDNTDAHIAQEVGKAEAPTSQVVARGDLGTVKDRDNKSSASGGDGRVTPQAEAHHSEKDSSKSDKDHSKKK